MTIQENIENTESSQNAQTPANDGLVFATMKDIYHVLMALGKEPKEILEAHEQEVWRLRETYLQYHTVDGEIDYTSHYRGERIVEKIKQYKPLPEKSPDHFVVEM